MKPITRRGPVYTRDLVSSLSASLSLVTEIARRSIIWVHTVLSFKLLNFHPTIILTETLLIEKEGERKGERWSSLKISQNHRSLIVWNAIINQIVRSIDEAYLSHFYLYEWYYNKWRDNFFLIRGEK